LYPASRFAEGLQSAGILESIRLFPELMGMAFCPQDRHLSAQMILALYETPNLPPKGSNKFSQQVKAIAWWRDFVEDLEGNNNKKEC